MQKPGTIGIRQFTILVTLITIGDSILILPAAVAKEAKYDGWLSGIIGVLIGLAIVYLYCIISHLYREHTLIGKNMLIFGRWLGTCLSILFLFTVLINGSVYVRAIGDFMTSQILKETPSVAVIFLLVASALFGARLGLETFARTSEIFYVWFVFTFLSFFFLLTPQFSIHNLQPVLENGIGPAIHGSFSVIAFPFSELIIFLMITPFVDPSQKLTPAFLRGATYGGICLIAIIILTLLVLGPSMTAQDNFPSYSLAKRVHVGEFFQRQEAMMALMWFVSIYFKVVTYMYGFCLGIQQLLKLREYKLLTYPTCLLFVVGAIILLPNETFLLQAYTFWPLFDFTVAVLYPLLLVACYYIRKRIQNEPTPLQK
ncbi:MULTISPECIES: GerAB/ArcD/ProY family transporter [Brevibacillus]|uniref:GerAB/ArcD/ProY family transporter n=1 Tax=Brevibacillus TaxID=55080 RepID=UPI00041E511D|nr:MULTISPECIES: endospore germination permease [Brevibacillus]MBG9566941.1 spore gernimation protein [Brevibacillus agri]MCG5254263.1 endospore germination permease [Brevibacillus agri]MED3501143.1 endospore germination permease [Brevibacillus agri]QHZ55363.1 endospore germination permease [Brevibacillus sp. NSP2.1]